MVRGMKFAVGMFAAAGGVFFVTRVVQNAEVRRLEAQVNQLEQERQQLRDFARRLSASRRVAQAEVIDQFPSPTGHPVNVLRWQEIAADGAAGLPQQVEAVGDLVYFEAAVIKFEEELVGQGDADRGTSLALFRRIFGDQQPSATVPPLDSTALVPAALGSNPAAMGSSRFFDLFWQFMEDPALAAQYRVRVAQCEAPAVLLRPGQVWEVTLDADGGLNLRIIGRRPVQPGQPLRDGPASTS